MKRILMAAATVLGLVASTLMPATAGPTPGGFTSEDVEYVTHVPFEVGTSTGVTIQGKYMYLTSWKNISVYDVSDPTSPELLDIEPVGFWFENEDVEVTPDGDYLFFSESTPQNSLHVWNVEDKSNISKVADVAGAGGHIFSCVLKCRYGYSTSGKIIDLKKPDAPKIVEGDTWLKLAGIQSGVHDVDEVKTGFIVASTYDEGGVFIDVRNPLKPKTIARGPKPEGKGYIIHSAAWPNDAKDRWLMLQGEQNAQPRCNPDQNGPFLTYDTKGWEKTGKFEFVDDYAVSNGTYQDGSPAVNGLGCSAHWFTAHPTFRNGGLVTIGYYEHGTRFLDIQSNGKIKEAGWFIPFAGSTSAAYWVPTDKEQRIVYAVDYTRGIDILRWNGKF